VVKIAQFWIFLIGLITYARAAAQVRNRGRMPITAIGTKWRVGEG